MPTMVPIYAEDFTLTQIVGQLCVDGPYRCQTCEAQCAFGRRFLREIDSDPRPGKPIVIPKNQVRPQIIRAQRRVYNALMDLTSGLDREEVRVKYGYENRKQMNAAIQRHKEKALARFGSVESAG